MVVAAGTLTANEITVLFLSLAALLGLARLLAEVARKCRQPAVLGEILAGVLLGPTVLAYISPEFFGWLFPTSSVVQNILDGYFTLAVALLLLTAGLEVDLSTVLRQGKATVWVSLTGMVFPFALGFGAAYLAPRLLGISEGAEVLPFALFIGIAMSITALPVIAKILMDLNMFKSDMGMLVMSAAMINDLIGWLGFAVVLAMISAQATPGGSSGMGQALMLTLLFTALVMTVGRWGVHRALPFIQAHSQWPGGVIAFVFVLAMLGAAATEAIGIHAIFGAFLVGIAIGDSSHLRERTKDTIHQFITSIFAPLFFASIGLRVNFVANFDLMLVLIVLVIAMVGKVGGCYLGAVWAGLDKREAWAIGFGMSARGAMEIVLGQLARQAGLISEELFVAIVIMALVTSLVSGPAIQRMFRDKPFHRLIDLLSERFLVADMEARTAREAIHELSARAADLLNIDVSLVYNTVWQREQMMSTGLERGIAVPHARLAQIKKPAVIIGRSERGVDFNAADGAPARIICLLLTPINDQTAQIQLLAAVARTFSDDDARRRFADSRSATEMLAALNLAQSTAEAHA